MKLKQFKEFVNNISSEHDNLEVLDTIRDGGAGMKIDTYFIYGDSICFLTYPRAKLNWLDGRFHKVNLERNK